MISTANLIEPNNDLEYICLLCDEYTNNEDIHECLNNYCNEHIKMMILSQNIYPIKCLDCDKKISTKKCFQMQILDEKEYDTIRTMKKFSQRIANKDLIQCFNDGCINNINKTTADDNHLVKCNKCASLNCTQCFCAHSSNQTCADWEKQNPEIVTARRRMEKLNERKIKRKQGMYCPNCQSFFDFNGGCDGVRCIFCNHQICRRTMQSRWGPNGPGDTSAGCKCGVNGLKCHARCRYCN